MGIFSLLIWRNFLLFVLAVIGDCNKCSVSVSKKLTTVGKASGSAPEDTGIVKALNISDALITANVYVFPIKNVAGSSKNLDMPGPVMPISPIKVMVVSENAGGITVGGTVPSSFSSPLALSSNNGEGGNLVLDPSTPNPISNDGGGEDAVVVCESIPLRPDVVCPLGTLDLSVKVGVLCNDLALNDVAVEVVSLVNGPDGPPHEWNVSHGAVVINPSSNNKLMNVGDNKLCVVNIWVVNIDSSELDLYVASLVMPTDLVVSVSSVGLGVNKQLVDVPVALLSANALYAHVGIISGDNITVQIDWLEGSSSSPYEVDEEDV
ncbi:hypothetical protein IEQ34_014161 [Dendrobium chrysotoxum]|uniref:Uncharacterized protein n=1 Tax=Dendrobium chrysotoxum TaxID=161865 RepID=A0AAV7G338_DENCH|nr:hypothetical protein IEQ34_014161 [Dendrobium chrysotoxum]